MDFVFGVFAGIFAAWVFGMLTRLLPHTWVRYQVKLGKLAKDEELGMWAWVLFVRIEPPRWKRVLMEPFKEYLEVTLALDKDKEKVVPGKWIEGDASKFKLRADGAMISFIYVFSGSGSTGILGDDTRVPLEQGEHIVNIGVMRSVDGTVAAEMEFHFTVDNNGKPTVDASLVTKFPFLTGVEQG